jgi:hypothetical protein
MVHAKGVAMRYRLLVETLENRLVPSALGVGDGAFQVGVTNPTPVGYTPAQIEHAYGFVQIASLVANGYNTAGQGQTIAVVMAGEQPNIVSDLHVFDQQFGIPDPTLVKMNENGSTTGPWPKVNASWASEISLDVEWSHAIAPAASIVLVEAKSGNLGDLLAAIDTARTYPGVGVVSMSWGLLEGSSELGYDGHFTTPAGHTPVTFVACTLDNGTTYPNFLYWPAVSPNVLSVGGTSLTLNSDNTIQSEVAWSAGTGGFSKYEKQPAYQSGVVSQGSTYRAVPDVSYHADNSSLGFAIYDTVSYFGQTGWFNAGGNSAGAPQWSALVAITNQLRTAAALTTLDGPSQTLPGLYSLFRTNAGLFYRDIVSGANGKYSAGPGYDLVTGMGTPHADQLVPALAGWNSGGAAAAAMIAGQGSAPTGDTVLVPWLACPCRCGDLAEQVQDRLPRGDRPREPIAPEAHVKWYVQRVVDRRAEILHPHRPIAHVGADTVGLTVDHAAADAGSCNDRRITIRPVNPARLALGVDARRAAELADHHHQRALQQAALVQVVEQRRERLVEARQAPAHAVGAAAEGVAHAHVTAVHVPAGAGRAAAGAGGRASPTVDGHAADARLDQPACQ